MKATIIHFFQVCGGGEVVALETANTLSEMGFEVVFATNSVKSMAECCMLLGKSMYMAYEAPVLADSVPLARDRFVRYKRLLLYEKVIDKARESSDLVVDTIMNMPSSADITYIHFPALIASSRPGLAWAVYDRLVYRKVLELTGEPGVVLANSKWTALHVEKAYGVKPRVLYPPVDVEYFKGGEVEKKKLITTVSRLTHEKNVHRLLGVRVPGYTWVIIGSTGRTRVEHFTSLRYYSKLLSEADKAKTHVVLRDQPRHVLRQYLQSAQFYVHPPYPEHFGISVVEAMAAGAIPIVYRDGGAWYDVVSRLDSRLGYRDVYEIPEIVKSIEGEVDELSRKAMETAREYSVEVFRRRLVDIVDEYLNKTTI